VRRKRKRTKPRTRQKEKGQERGVLEKGTGVKEEKREWVKDRRRRGEGDIH